MRTLGLLGGMSWESTAQYYRMLNEGVKARRGGLRSAPLLIHSFDFAPIADRQAAGDWDGLADALGRAGRGLVAAGAEALLICTNTMHRVHAAVQQAAGVPVLHIADPTGAALLRSGCRRPLLLGTRFTMEGDFYRGRLAERFGLDAIVPDEAGRAAVHRVIYEELCRGIVQPDSRADCLALVEAARQAGADSLILGCTELMLLIGPGDTDLPLFDTTALHAEAGVAFIAGTEGPADAGFFVRAEEAPMQQPPPPPHDPIRPVLRRATPADAASVRTLTREAYAKWVPLLGREPKPMTADHDAAIRDHLVDLLEVDGHLAAVIEMRPGPDHLLIVNVAVSPPVQGRGHGRALLAHAEATARSLGRSELRLYTNGRFAENLALYGRAGYRVDREETSILGVTVYLSKRLGPPPGGGAAPRSTAAGRPNDRSSS